MHIPGLDGWITGNWGQDVFRGAARCEVCGLELEPDERGSMACPTHGGSCPDEDEEEEDE